MVHPNHDELAASVHATNRTAFPEMGWRVQRLPFGWLRWHDLDPELSWAWVVLEPGVTEADALLTGLGAEFPSWAQLRLRIDHGPQRELLVPGLRACGYEELDMHVELAYVGKPPAAVALAQVTVEDTPADQLVEWAETKLRGFGIGDAAPTARALEHELALRRAELGGDLRLRLLRVGGEPAAVIGWNDGPYVDVFNLATRLAYRHRGLARLLLTQVIRESLHAGRRAVIIGTNPEDTPIHWYRRLGFTDELRRSWNFEHRLRRA